MVNHSNGIFLREADILELVIPDEDKRRRAFFNLIAYEAYKLLANPDAKLPRPPCIQTGQDLPSWAKFIETQVGFNAASRVHKDDLHFAANQYFGKIVLEQDLFTNLKSYVQYDKSMKSGGQRGFFVGVSLVHDYMEL